MAVGQAIATFSPSDHNTTTQTLTTRDGSYKLYTRCKRSGEFAMTFDDGPWKYNTKVVQDLDDATVTGTFFVNGENYGCIYDYAEELRQAFDHGHIIASHTWSHQDIAELSRKQLNTELDKLEVAFKKILGVKPKLFRPPFGSYDEAALKVLQSRGYSTILWSMDCGDSNKKSASYSIKTYQKQAARYPAPGIGLNHEVYKKTAYNVVPRALEIMQDAGYKMVSVSDCIDVEPYEYVGGREERNASWQC